MQGIRLEECFYSPSRKLNYYTERLAGLMRIVAKNRGASTYAYTKEIRRALEALVYVGWDKHEDFITEIARSQIPTELRTDTLRRCFTLLLEGLLRKFREEAEDLPMGSRILLMNMILASIANMAQYYLPPGGNEFLNRVFSSSKSGSESEGDEES